ncbi:MAG: ABC transporter permease subunit [Clostridiaceae bacterium]
MMLHTIKSKKYLFIGIGLMISLWWGLSIILNNEIILPSPPETVRSLKSIVTEEFFSDTLSATLKRCALSFGISLVLALIAGIAAALNRKVFQLFIPVTAILKAVPTIAIIVLALIWLNNEQAPVLIASIVIFPVFYEAVINGVTGINGDIISMTQIYRVRTRDAVRYVYLPNILKNILGVLSSVIGLSLKMVIGGEVLGQPRHGIGTNIQIEKMQLNTPSVFGWIIILITLVLLTEYVIRLLTKKWRTFD